MIAITSLERKLLIDPWSDYRLVAGVRQNKNLIGTVDKNPQVLALLLAGEVKEVRDERERIDTQIHKGDKHPKEAYVSELGDVSSYFHALCRRLLHAPIDFGEAIRISNGMAKLSGVYENMVEIGLNLPDCKNEKDFIWFYANWISLLTHAPFFIDGRRIMRGVIVKNDGNYPHVIFHAPDITDKDELDYAYTHRVTATKMIRKFIKRLEGERPLRRADYEQHLNLILNYSDSENGLSLLSQRLRV